MSTKPEQVQDSSVSEDAADQPKSNAITFIYGELATATNNFRQDSLIGEGGLRPLERGKLENTGQVIFRQKFLGL